MSTNSRIGMLKEDGSVVSIYCHWDGYLEHVGDTLRQYYNYRYKVEELIALGALSSLRKDIKEIISYHKWKGEPIESDMFISKEQYVKEYINDIFIEYIYLFMKGDWYHYSNKKWIKLTKEYCLGE